MPVINVQHFPETLLNLASVRSLLEPIRQHKLPVDCILPPVRICAFRATCRAAVCRNEPACPGSKGH
jgi:hypothetical protein